MIVDDRARHDVFIYVYRVAAVKSSLCSLQGAGLQHRPCVCVGLLDVH